MQRRSVIRGRRLVVSFIGLVGFGCLAGALARLFAGHVDLSAVRDVAAWHTRFLTAASRDVSWAGTVTVIAPLAVLACGWLLGRRRQSGALAVVLAAVGAVALSSLVKVIVDRPRPPIHHLVNVTSASFPSGHATESSAFYLIAVVVIVWPLEAAVVRWIAVALLLALILAVSFSRVYLGVHYPTDVAGGLLLGSGWTWAVLRSVAPGALEKAR